VNLAQVIHQRWAASPELAAMLPAARVFTGLSCDTTVPYAVIGRRGCRPAHRYGDGSGCDVVALRIEVFDDDYDRAAAVLHQLKAAMDRASFPLAGADKVLSLERTDDFEGQADDGTWRLVIDLACTVYLATGV
jgi:hypothetical protein